LGAAGRSKVLQNYTWETVADQVRAVYVEATSRREGHRKLPRLPTV
jgi:hypothetical protein